MIPRILVAAAVMLVCAMTTITASAQCYNSCSQNACYQANGAPQAQFIENINFACLAPAWQAAVGHQCATPERPFLCKLEKMAVGALTYRECNGGSFGMIRSRLAVRRMNRSNGDAIGQSVRSQSYRQRSCN